MVMSSRVRFSIVLGPILSVLTILGNGLVLWTILRPANRDRLRTPTNLLIASLAMTDFLSGLGVMPSVIFQDYGMPHNYVGCLTMLALSLLLAKASMIGFLILTAERYVAVAFPFRYENLVSPRNMRILIVVQWCLAGVYATVLSAVNQGWNYMNMCLFHLVVDHEMIFYVGSIFSGFCPTVIIAGLYTYIFVVAIQHSRRMPLATLPFPPLSSGNQSAEHSTSHGTNQPRGDAFVHVRHSRLARELRIAKRCFVAVGVFILFNIPSSIMNTLSLWFHVMCPTCTKLFVWFLLTNSTINPMLYAYGGSGTLRKHLKMTLIFWKRTSEVSGNHIQPSPS